MLLHIKNILSKINLKFSRPTIYDIGIMGDDQFRFPVKPTNGNINDPDFKKKLIGMFGLPTTVKGHMAFFLW